MIRIFIYGLLLCFISSVDLQQPNINNFYILIPQIDQTYNIVTTFIYPAQATNKFVATVAPDYFYLKQKEQKNSQPGQAKQSQNYDVVMGVYIQLEAKKQIGIPQKQIILPVITEYSVTKQMYSNVQLPQQNIIPSIAISKPNRQAVQTDNTQKIIFDNKSIEMKVSDQISTVAESGIQVPIGKTLQNVNEKHKEQPIIHQSTNLLTSNSQKAQPQIITPLISTPFSSQSQLRPDNLINKQSTTLFPNVEKDSNSKNLSLNKQTGQIKTKNTHWSMTVIVLIIVFILSIFLIYRFKGSSKTQIWRDIQQKLQVYKQSVPIYEDQDETLNSFDQRDGFSTNEIIIE